MPQKPANDLGHPRAGLQRIERGSASLRRPEVSHVIFDFDGTLSWLRHGWPRIMLEGFLRHAPVHWQDDRRLADDLLADILSLNGKPSIHQMRSFAERLERVEGLVVDPERLLAEYQEHLQQTIAKRRAAIERGPSGDAFVVHGARGLLERLRARGVALIILSGTVQEEVRAEAGLLGLQPFFGEHIYGSGQGTGFSKQKVIEQLMREEHIEGHRLLSFGDGPVEIQVTKAVGGLAIGVASDEEQNGSHQCDPYKREQLLRAGADAMIPDYAEAEGLVLEIFGHEKPF